MTYRIITIDGPFGAGKTTAAKHVAKRLGMSFLNYGLIFRIIAYKARDAGVAFDDEAGCAEVTKKILKIETDVDGFKIDGKKISLRELSNPSIKKGATQISAYIGIRPHLPRLLQSSTDVVGTVAEGRDMGSVVFSEVFLKIFLTADEATRKARILAVVGENSLEQAFAQDRNEASRLTTQPKLTDDMFVIDSTFMTPVEVVNTIIALYKAKTQQVRSDTWRQATQIIKELLGDNVEVVMLNCLSKGVRGDAATYDEAVMLNLSGKVDWEILEKVSTELTNQIITIGRVTINIVPKELL